MDLDVTTQADFVAQVTRYQSALRAYIISLMPGLDGVSDVLQETNLVLWKKRKTFKPGTNFRAWACAIARFEVIAHRRKLLRQGVSMLDEELAEQLADHCETDPEEADERLIALECCLERLGDKERNLIEHRYASHASLSEYAAQCQRPVGSLRVTLFRIRAALKKCINSHLATERSRL